jgi:hypothetical protein
LKGNNERTGVAMVRLLESAKDGYREFMTKRAYEIELEELGLYRFEPSYERKTVQPKDYPSLHPEGPLGLWDISCEGCDRVFREILRIPSSLEAVIACPACKYDNLVQCNTWGEGAQFERAPQGKQRAKQVITSRRKK